MVNGRIRVLDVGSNPVLFDIAAVEAIDTVAIPNQSSKLTGERFTDRHIDNVRWIRKVENYVLNIVARFLPHQKREKYSTFYRAAKYLPIHIPYDHTYLPIHIGIIRPYLKIPNGHKMKKKFPFQGLPKIPKL
jgi:hypothetical protein